MRADRWQVFLLALALAMAYVALPAEQGAQGPAPNPEQQQRTIEALVQAVNEARETSQAQAAALVEKSKQIQALQAAIAPACVAAVEKANPGKTLDEKTMAITDKPKPAEKGK